MCGNSGRPKEKQNKIDKTYKKLIKSYLKNLLRKRKKQSIDMTKPLTIQVPDIKENQLSDTVLLFQGITRGFLTFLKVLKFRIQKQNRVVDSVPFGLH